MFSKIRTKCGKFNLTNWHSVISYLTFKIPRHYERGKFANISHEEGEE